MHVVPWNKVGILDNAYAEGVRCYKVAGVFYMPMVNDTCKCPTCTMGLALQILWSVQVCKREWEGKALGKGKQNHNFFWIPWVLVWTQNLQGWKAVTRAIFTVGAWIYPERREQFSACAEIQTSPPSGHWRNYKFYTQARQQNGWPT